MASTRKIIAIDLGASTIKLGEFSITGKGTMTLLRFAVDELGLDPNKEEDRSKFITATLKRLMADLKVKKGREVLLTVSSQSVFTRFVKLPVVDVAQVEQVVGFEAQQNVPFPIQEVVWDYQMMSSRASGNDLEAVIVAVKKDVVDTEVRAVEAAGFIVKKVDVAPLGLFNAFRYSAAEWQDCSLIIDIGARCTNLIFVEKTGFWVRNVPIAGNQISQNICNELQEPFFSAETLKKGKGFVSLGGAYADPDDADAARISKLIRATMTRLHIDINRSIAYYRTTLNGAAPQRVFLTGGSSQLPYLDLFIAEKLNLPVSYFNALRNVNLGSAINASKLQHDSCYTGEIVGLALREMGNCPAEITLDAPVMTQRREQKRKKPFYLAALLIWTVFFICFALWQYQQLVVAQNVLQDIKDKTQNVQGQVSKIQQLSSQQDKLQLTLNLAVRLGQQRNQWVEIMNALNSKIPPGMWITELVPQQDKTGGRRGPGRLIPNNPANVPHDEPETVNVLLINGLYHANSKTELLDISTVSGFVESLAEVPYFDVDKNHLQDTLISTTTADSDPDSFAQRFTLKLKLRQPINLQP